jgi:hypothetical protein
LLAHQPADARADSSKPLGETARLAACISAEIA